MSAIAGLHTRENRIISGSSRSEFHFEMQANIERARRPVLKVFLETLLARKRCTIQRRKSQQHKAVDFF